MIKFDLKDVFVLNPIFENKFTTLLINFAYIVISSEVTQGHKVNSDTSSKSLYINTGKGNLQKNIEKRNHYGHPNLQFPPISL
jgi:hypothetical protein